MKSILCLLALLSMSSSVTWAAPGPRPETGPETSAGHRAPETRVRRFAVVIGANHGGTDRVRLRYALDDAESFAAVMQIYGGVAPERLFRVDEPGPDQVAAAFAAVHAALAAEAHGTGASGGGAPDRTELLVYYSGHADADGLLLGGQRLPYATLRQHINAVPASVRIGIVDACASGAFVRAKGGQRRPPFLVDQAVQVTGHAYLASASADEAAQESDRLKASYFSHALVTGLRGAADVSGDGVVTLNEAYQFAFRETLARTEGSHLGAQHPSYDMQLVGSGDVVLTDLRATSAALLVGSDVGGRLYVRDADGRLLAELDKPRGQAIRLGLAPGDYRVRLEDLDGVGHAARLRLVEGGATHLAAADLSPVPAEPGRARGADVLGPAAGMALGSPAGAGPGAGEASTPAPAVAPLDDSELGGGGKRRFVTLGISLGTGGGVITEKARPETLRDKLIAPGFALAPFHTLIEADFWLHERLAIGAFTRIQVVDFSHLEGARVKFKAIDGETHGLVLRAGGGFGRVRHLVDVGVGLEDTSLEGPYMYTLGASYTVRLSSRLDLVVTPDFLHLLGDSPSLHVDLNFGVQTSF